MTKKNLTASIDIDAAPEQVWGIVSDLKRMPEWSDQCRLMRPLGRVRVGALTVNMNHRGRRYWPTVSRIERFEPGHAIAFRTLSNDSVWHFEITPTATGSTVVHRRTVPPHGTKWISYTIVDHWLGGEETFDIEMEEGLNNTLRRIKAALEHRPAGIRPRTV
ncbi:SRPBCC family protein [Nocardia sp. NPDC020380]|uniref:SRPBCC family protein n=1 Tax=Nocardia sp. NPDC020380 TaxID=3364309 RepID=UPI00379E84FB